MYQYIFFDLDGTLTDSKEGIFNCLKYAFEKLDKPCPGEETLIRFIGICESTPGPIAVNMATFVGSAQAGLAGAACATLGVVLPALLVMLLIAAVLRGFRENASVRAAMSGIRPVVAGMILATGLWMALRCLLLQEGEGGWTVSVDWRQIAITLALCVGTLFWRRRLKRTFSPILLILFSAVCGIALYGF
jgi:chromate transporter